MLNRRIFLAATAANLGSRVVQADPRLLRADDSPADDWLEAVRSSRAALFLDAASFSRSFAHFDRAAAYLDGEEAEGRRAVALIGLHGEGLAHGLSPQIWAEWDLPSHLGVVAAEGAQNENRLRAWLEEMAHRRPGRVKVLACQRTLIRWILQNEPTSHPTQIIQAKNVLIPSVTLVSAMVNAAARAQFSGAAYAVSNA